MNKARIEDTDEIVNADTLLEFFPNYKELVFVCIDKKCSVRMAPSCIKKKNHRKPHFKKYRNSEHIETCEYATINELYEKGKKQKLSQTQINKIGYPSVFNLNDGNDDGKRTSQARLNNEDEGVTGRGGSINKLYEFDGENIKFDRRNKVQSIDRIVDWYLGFPHNRDVEIELNGTKTPYRYFFKFITEYTDPTKLQNDRIFYGKIQLTSKNEDVFKEQFSSVFFRLLGFKNKNEINGKPLNYSVRIDKNSMSKNTLTRIKNKYNLLFEHAFTEFQNGLNHPDINLYVFVYGTIDKDNDTVLNVNKHHIAFRFTEVRKTITEES